ncbi:hypothetical protein F0562_021656 [Nyssa sinensis]|uniref:Uncharacterized protein n=1 Tax=Nyssa sinensis TaxID=561372 RepID=A0A5J5BLP1_9ASTE|nr:hypothetical protein F0562_021656 [Nyssa sinensis]
MSQADVSYSCGSCAYPLNLTSSNRITSGIGSEYRKSLKKGYISFLSIDLSRFTQVDEINCLPISWGRYRSKTKLLCRKCGVLIGINGVGFKGCSKSLAYLEANSCELEPEGILGIVSGGGLEYLTVSNLSWSICGDGSAPVGAGFATKLRILNFRMCRTIGDDSVVAIAKGCPLLQEWNLALCHEVRISGGNQLG